MQNLTFGQYYPGSSVIHKLDPRTKLLALIPLIITITTNWNLNVLLIQYTFLAAILVLSKIPFSLYIRQLRIFVLIIFATFILHALFTSGETLFVLPLLNLEVTKEGIQLGLFFSVRLLLVIAFSLILMFTTSPTDMVSGLEKILRPLKKIGISTDKFALLLGITIKFIPVIFEEADRIKKAQISRGANFTGSVRNRIHSVTSLVVPLFMSVFRRADTLAMALQVKGYPGKGPRTYYRDLTFRHADMISFAVITIISMGLFLL